MVRSPHAHAGHEYGAVRVEASGRVTVITGTSPHGQGTATTLAQIVADELGMTPEDVTVLQGVRASRRRSPSRLRNCAALEAAHEGKASARDRSSSTARSPRSAS